MFFFVRECRWEIIAFGCLELEQKVGFVVAEIVVCWIWKLKYYHKFPFWLGLKIEIHSELCRTSKFFYSLIEDVKNSIFFKFSRYL